MNRLRERLVAMSDPDYRQFNASLLPGVTDLIGIRLPRLRALAREIARGDAWHDLLRDGDIRYFEERMLRGLVIGYVRCPVEERLAWVRAFVPTIDNWAVCDAFCWRLRKEEREPMWRLIRPLFDSPREFEARFAAVTALGNFVDEDHLDELLGLLDAVRCEAYYARMGVAWAVSVCYVKFPERTEAWLDRCRLDDWTFNRSLQKITESWRVEKADKQRIRAMKRPAK
ncbi:DNA alkylation repair protein [uncultured Alistipes sp.]|uniref:DNA alkylation repair protein n=1 Tax=uncultured Alistipes sp. TaxID=538949 RepID=UPI002615C6AF|nr:DNA alkylation repair protein [uncultured Alistipes sp.]